MPASAQHTRPDTTKREVKPEAKRFHVTDVCVPQLRMERWPGSRGR